MKRLVVLALAAAAAVAGGAAGHSPTRAVADTTTQAPTKIAVIIEENKDYTQIVGAASTAPYINGSTGPLSLAANIAPTTGCTYVTGEQGSDTGTACTSGMFPSYRATTGYRDNGSAPEYAFLSMGTDADIRDTNFPSAGTGRGYSPLGNTSNPTYNIFDYAEANSKSFTVYNEDYLGSSTQCDQGTTPYVQWSDSTHNFYARKHNPFLLTWNQTHDAATTSGQTPASAPSDQFCKDHMRNFPGNTPNATVDVQTNFTGSETFGDMTIITPSMCHDGHNGDALCGTNKGGVKATDAWLAANLDGVRKDVGENGVVIVTWDEDSSDCDGTGHCVAMPTWIMPGLDSNGNTTASMDVCAGASSCNVTNAIYDYSSLNKTLLQFLGGSCSVLNDTNIDQGQALSAQDMCSAATAVPTTLRVTTGSPWDPAWSQGAQADNGSGSATSVGVAWPSATTGGDFLLAAVAAKGTVTGITGPGNGWTLAKQASGKNVSLWYCANCTSQSGTQTWTFPEGHRAVVSITEYPNISTSAALDDTGTATSGSDTTRLDAFSGMTGSGDTAQAAEVLFTAVMVNNGLAVFEPPSSALNTVIGECQDQTQSNMPIFEQDEVYGGNVLAMQVNLAVLNAQGHYCSITDYDTETSYRGVAATFTNS